MVASAIVAPRTEGTWGAFPDAELVAAVVSDSQTVDVDRLADGLCYMLGLRNAGLELAVVNVSIGLCASEVCPAGQERLRSVIAALGDAGVLVVASASNAGLTCPAADGGWPFCSDHDVCGFLPASIELPNMVGVAASTAAGGMSTGGGSPPSLYGHGSRTIELAAPGSRINILNHDGEAILASGSSFAAPIVSAIAAMIFAYAPEDQTPGPAALRWRLVRAVVPGDFPPDALRTCSGGIVNAPRAIAGLGDAGARCPALR